ncbi:hypothetical protein MP638_002396 [Amoeboaphelidium occidentale]|nr:hypothetical protein MP638_002396 [Amoeboaphelidium occidentale]
MTMAPLNFRQNTPMNEILAILLSFNRNILSLIELIGRSNVYVSLLENGSSDKSKDLLEGLRAELLARKVEHRILTEDEPKEFVRRIPYLAELRNKVMEPLRNHNETNRRFDRVVFFNDILWDYSDVFRLLSSYQEHYDALCGLDFDYTFYDSFATRDFYDGQAKFQWPPSNYKPYFFNKTSQDSVWKREHVRVFSCWNGLAVLNAKPFYDGALKLRNAV